MNTSVINRPEPARSTKSLRFAATHWNKSIFSRCWLLCAICKLIDTDIYNRLIGIYKQQEENRPVRVLKWNYQQHVHVCITPRSFWTLLQRLQSQNACGSRQMSNSFCSGDSACMAPAPHAFPHSCIPAHTLNHQHKHSQPAEPPHTHTHTCLLSISHQLVQHHDIWSGGRLARCSFIRLDPAVGTNRGRQQLRLNDGRTDTCRTSLISASHSPLGFSPLHRLLLPSPPPPHTWLLLTHPLSAPSLSLSLLPPLFSLAEQGTADLSHQPGSPAHFPPSLCLSHAC